MLHRVFAALRVPAGLALLAMWLAAGQAVAHDARTAEAFVEREAQYVINTLRAYHSGEISADSVRQDFRERVEQLADVERITGFVLGRYRRGADPDVLQDFSAAFREFAVQIYERELGNYAGQTLRVTGSVTRRPGDYVVRSVVEGPDGQADMTVNWRVMDGPHGLRVVDVEVMGVWLALTQREQITGIIGNARGDIRAAIRVLESRLESNNFR